VHQIRIRRSVELAHRLSHTQAPQKCQSIHGHSWRIDVHIGALSLDDRDMLVEFGAFKQVWFHYLDDHVCHHLALNRADPYVSVLQKIDPNSRLLLLDGQPTTEHLAQLFFQKANHLIKQLRDDAEVTQVCLQETSRNMAIYSKPS